MSSFFSFRLLLGVAISLGIAALLVFVLHLTETSLYVIQQLQEAPWWFLAIYVVILLTIVSVIGIVVWKFVPFVRKQPSSNLSPSPPPNETEVEQQLARAETLGLDISEAKQEFQELIYRRDAGEIFIALFGEVSTGKSSLVKAILPDVEIEISPVAGTTQSVNRYTWQSPVGDRLILTDLPGLNEPDGDLSELSRQEAIRAHIVIYVLDGDLTRDQHQELQVLLEFRKPFIVALNKMDRYSEDILQQLRERLMGHLAGLEHVQFVAVSAGGEEEVVRIYPNGQEERIIRQRQAQVENLLTAIQDLIDQDRDLLEKMRDASVFTLIANQVDEKVLQHQREKSQLIIQGYTRKAMLGALASVSPGSDLIIQGYLGIELIKELCALYEVPAKEMDIRKFLEIASKRIKKTTPIVLAVAGNACKAFIGIGTLAGGALHAVAYGLLFEGLGKSIALTLEKRGHLSTEPALRAFEESMSEHLEKSAYRFARMVLEGDAKNGKENPRKP